MSAQVAKQRAIPIAPIESSRSASWSTFASSVSGWMPREKLCTRMQSKASQVLFVYEAGPCGYGLQRYLARKGYGCMVCAPSLIAKKPGDKVKTDRRDAENLVRLLRTDDLTAVLCDGHAGVQLVVRDALVPFSETDEQLLPGQV